MIPERIIEMMKLIEKAGFEAYIIGGAVRDIKLGITPKDYDIFTNATGEQILKIFPDGNIIGSEERQEKILTVVVDGVEISQYRSNGDRTKTGTTLRQHCGTSDFSINSMAMNKDGKLFDFYGGEKDLYEGVIRFVGSAERRIEEDLLRLLRGIRFAAKYQFKFEAHTEASIRLNAYRIEKLPQERVRDELIKILRYPKGMSYLIFYGFIDYIFPEYKKVKGMNGGDHHNEIVDEHMLNAFELACKITDNPNLRLACFLHDIGKGITYTTEEDGTQTHFYEHENKGEEMMQQRLSHLKFSNEDKKYITALIRLHMYTYKVEPGKKSYIRFFNKLEEAKISIEDYIMLIYSDHQANMAKPRIKFGDFIKDNWLHKKYYEIKYSEEPMSVKDLKITGHDIMEYGLKGKEIGDILNKAFDEVMDGNIKNNRAELLYALKGWIKCK